MHCKECGYPFAKGEEVCSQCGTPRERLEIDWNLSNYPEPGKVEDLEFNWNTGEFTEHKEADPEQAAVSVMPEISKVPEQQINPADLGIPFITREEREALEGGFSPETEPVAEPKEAPAVPKIPSISEIHEEPAGFLDSLDKFFEYDKASNEFQRLLEAQQNRVQEFDTVVKPQIEPAPAIPFIDSFDIKEGEVEKEDEPEVIWLGKMEQVKAEEVPVIEIKPVVEPEPATEPEPVTEAEQDAEPAVEPEPEIEAEPAVEPEPEIETEPVAEPAVEPAAEDEPLWWMEPEDDEEEEATEGFKAGDVILGVLTVSLIIIGLFIGSIIGIQHFKPESPAAEKAALIQESITSTLSQAKNKIESLFFIKDPEDFIDESEDSGGESAEEQDNEGEEEQQEEQGEEQKPDPIDSVVLLNTNIKIIKANNNLGFEKGKDYGKQSISESVLVQDGQEKVLERIIEFNSKWVDYVNNNKKDVIELTKKGSQARKNVETFTKVGKVKQDFLLLEIGEIRKTKDEYFIWVHEEIQEEKDGQIQTIKYNYVYSMESVNGNMLITNYYKY